MTAVTFDYGQTLAELDTEYLSRRVMERGADVSVERLEAELPAAWRAYDAAKMRGDVAFAAWGAFMSALLSGAGVRAPDGDPAAATNSLVQFLWAEQPGKNLWRRPIAGMLELVSDLAAAGVPLGIVSNSEGRLAALLEEMGLARHFRVIGDSGVLGFEKPDRRIFDHVTAGLGVAATDFIHVGDAWVADIEGAVAIGARAIWVTAHPGARTLPGAVRACTDAAQIRAALRSFGVPA